jgi:8-oxo-dGTP pyrophosphatase MutT (NUDIX family)
MIVFSHCRCLTINPKLRPIFSSLHVTETISPLYYSIGTGVPLRVVKRNFAVKGKEAWDRQQARLARLPFRRDGKPRDVKKTAFREWYDKQRIYMSLHDRKARQHNLEFQIRVMTVVERLPIVTPDMPKWEKDYEDLRDYLDCFGRVYPAEAGIMEPEGDDPGDDYYTDEELFAMLPEGLKPAPRITEADESGDDQTLNRKLMHKIFLLIQRKDGFWTFPSTLAKKDETLLQAAKRAVKETAGPQLELYCPSNCPIAVKMIVFSEEERNAREYYGEKTFLYRVQRDDGDATMKTLNPDEVLDYGWLTKDEVLQRVPNFEMKFYHYML